MYVECLWETRCGIISVEEGQSPKPGQTALNVKALPGLNEPPKRLPTNNPRHLNRKHANF
ncbi:hypothetical protein PILCRDRAFT_818640 [Piloderma croceum F 1598]|uniref:Uncharacterized protein n=1 Tax=Piloderma croceum (strain F 1598) TaxID=765440 RepID=A0A0C3G0T7_PILCF|nr:hypothetical protein PILCRDRAFT_818640 [Piloderma croceum F 1598]